MTRAPWDFAYLPVRRSDSPEEGTDDFVVATWTEVGVEKVAQALGSSAKAEALLLRPPIFWYRVRLPRQASLDSVKRAVEGARLPFRYVASSLAPSLALGPRADFANAARCEPRGWAPRSARAQREQRTPGRWFLDEQTGVAVDRSVCGFGAGTRLAVIDDEGMYADALQIDAEVAIGDIVPPRASAHGASVVAWAVGTRGRASANVEPFIGVAPGASARLYYIPKPDRGLPFLPCALIRAVDDGADVVVCATYVERMTSPMLDDALEFAVRLGRNGRGTPVVLPTGREVSSAGASVSASLTLGFGDPASDSRVLCVAPSGRTGGWFLWPEKSGKLRPFANRGPAVRVAAPGDDIAFPFVPGHRLGHAESSGASAIAAGVTLLLISTNPELEVTEVYELLSETATMDRQEPHGVLADPSDFLPRGSDADGHCAKVGYGRLSALRACLAASDPVAFGLMTMGDEAAARRYVRLIRLLGKAFYSPELARWSARVVAKDGIASHAVRTILRHLRLLAGHRERYEAQTPGAIVRSVALIIDQLKVHPSSAAIADELERLHRISLEATQDLSAGMNLEKDFYRIAGDLWGSPSGVQPLTRDENARGAPSLGGLGDSA